MLSYLLFRVFYAGGVLIGVLLLVFLLFNVLPADPARMTMGQRSDVQSLEAARVELGLDKPLWEQFIYFANDVSPISLYKNSVENQNKYHYVPLLTVGEYAMVVKFPYLRRSYQSKREVSAILLEVIPNTLVLTLGAIIFASVVGISLGILAAVKKGTWIDSLALSTSILGISLPSVFASVIIAWIFGFVLHNYTGLNMSGSLHDYDPFKGETVALKNLWLPLITLGIRPLAVVTQLTRNALLEVLQTDYIRTARAKGLSEYIVIFKHALRNALNPVLTAVSGWFASLLAGSFFVEYIFGYNGLGKTTVDALENFDFPVVMGAVLFCGFIFVFVNMAVDILYAFIDPRIKLR